MKELLLPENISFLFRLLILSEHIMGQQKPIISTRSILRQNIRTADMENEFAYPGPKPFSKEMAIVMMADAVEASSRTLDKYTEYTISELVERIFIIQEQDDQFSDAPLDLQGYF